MSINTITTLAVAVGAKAIGFAIFNNSVLQYYAVKTIPSGRTTRNAAHILQQQINGLISTFQPDVLAIKQTVAVQKDSAFVKTATKRIRELSSKRNLQYFEYSSKAIRQALCQTSAATRQDVVAHIARLFPELTHFLKRTRKWEQAYYGNMLDAIAIGFVCTQDLSAKQASADK